MISNLVDSDFILLPDTNVKALLEIVDELESSQKEKLLFQCININKENLQRIFHERIGNSIESIKLIINLTSKFPTLYKKITTDGVPLVSTEQFRELIELLKRMEITELHFLVDYIIKLTKFEDFDLLKILFANLSYEQIGFQIFEFIVKFPVPAITGLMYNNSLNVFEKILGNLSNNHDEVVINLLELRKKQITGSPIHIDFQPGSTYKEAFTVLLEQNTKLMDKYNSSWSHSQSDEKNSGNTKFVIPTSIKTYKTISTSSNRSIKRALIGQGFIVINESSKATLHLIGQNELLDLCEIDQTVIFGDKIVACKDNLVMIFDVDGALKHVEVLDSTVLASPKSADNGELVIVDANNKIYTIYEDFSVSFVDSLVGYSTIQDFIIFKDLMVFATTNKLIIKENEELVIIESSEEIINIIGDKKSVYAITNKGINKYELNSRLFSGFYEFGSDPNTSVVLADENVLAFGSKDRITIVNLSTSNGAHRIIRLENNEEIVDLIVCDNSIIAICKSGGIYKINGSTYERIDYDQKNLGHASISAGSGIVCISTANALLLCKNSA